MPNKLFFILYLFGDSVSIPVSKLRRGTGNYIGYWELKSGLLYAWQVA